MVLYLGVLAAGAYEDGMNLIDFMGRFAEAMEHPLSVHWTAYTPKFMLGALLLYLFGIWPVCVHPSE